MLALQKNEVFADRYLLRNLIGTRGISEVWVCNDLQENDAIVAVKVYAPLDRVDEKFMLKLKQEVTANQELSHPNLLQIKDFNIYAGVPYTVMPYMEQGSLRRRLLEGGPLKEYEIAVLLKQVGGALHHLHTLEPPHLHQNIKPDNILLTENENYVLADFRIHNQVRAVLPRMGAIPEASPTAYAPPELFTVRPSTHEASDIFALGVTIYELCTGQLPWMGNGGLSLLQGAAVPYLPATYAKELNNIVTACMDPKWENRPTAEELAMEGNYYIDNQRWKPYGRFSANKVDVVQYKKSSPLKAVLWVAAILIALSAIGFFLFTQTDVLKNTFGSAAESDAMDQAIVVTETDENGGDEDTPSERAASEQETAPATPLAQDRTPPPAVEERTTRTTAAETPPSEPAATQPEREPEVKRPAYPKPASAEEYLAQLQNNKIPYSVREKWRQDVWRFFDRRAAVNYVVGDELVGILSADELVEIMLDRENTTAIRIDSTTRNAAGKVERVFVHVQPGADTEQ